MSLKLEIRLHAYQFSKDRRSDTEEILHSFDWFMRSELGYIAWSLITGFNNDVVTLIFIV